MENVCEPIILRLNFNGKNTIEDSHSSCEFFSVIELKLHQNKKFLKCVLKLFMSSQQLLLSWYN